MRQKLSRFMIGRNGADALFRCTSYAAIILLLISTFLGRGLRDVCFLIAVALIIYTYYRVFSKNLGARHEENARYLRQKQRLTSWIKLRRDMWKQRGEFKFFKCPACKSLLRVPKGKGKIRVVCKKCGNAFEKKT